MLASVSARRLRVWKLRSVAAISISVHYRTLRGAPLIMVVLEGHGHDHLYPLQPAGRDTAATPRAVHGSGQGAHPRRDLRRLLEGVGGHGGEGDQRIPPQLHGPAASRD